MIGAMRERLLIQYTTPPVVFRVASLTRTSTTATATTTGQHGYASNDYVTLAGASPTGYNGKVKISVTSETAFTFAVSSGLSTPATGAITATYASDAQGGRRMDWTTLGTVFAEVIPIRASERLQLQAIQSDVAYRFRVRVRADFAPTQRIVWTPSWPRDAAQQTLDITGVLSEGNGRRFQYLDASVAS